MKPIMKRQNSRKRFLLGIFILVIAIAAGLYIFFQFTGNKTEGYAGPSIKVYGQILPDNEFNRYLLTAMADNMSGQITGHIRDIALTSAIKDIATEHMIKQVSAQTKIKVTAAEVKAEIKQKWPTEEQMQIFMEKRGYRNLNEFKKSVIQNIEWQRFMVYKGKEWNIQVPQAEVLGQLEQISVRHILVGVKDPATEKPLRNEQQALQRANEVYQKAMNGEDFAGLAKEYSDEASSRDAGGALGQLPLDLFKMFKEESYVDAALALKENQISPPVKTQAGYYIIRLDSRYLPKGAEYEQQYRAIENERLIRNVRESATFKDYLQKIIKQAEENMEILDPALRAYRLKKDQKWAEAALSYEQALGKKYYQNQADIYQELADAYLQSNQPAKAIAVLKRAPVGLTDTIEFQGLLATAYKENNQMEKAQDTLTQFGEAHPDSPSVHQYLQKTFTDWGLADLAAKETEIVSKLQKQETEGN
jgi:parvulin-like peptidyl-prolyl isomerase